MTEEMTEVKQAEEPKPKVKPKRDIFRFNGEKLTSINLEHVTNMCLEEKRITFSFYSTSVFVELADEAAAASIYEVITNAWGGNMAE